MKAHTVCGEVVPPIYLLSHKAANYPSARDIWYFYGEMLIYYNN